MIVANTPAPPFRAKEGCLGHAYDYASTWSVADRNGMLPRAALDEMTPNTIVDREWCVRMT